MTVSKHQITENGRECSACLEYKTWSRFRVTRASSTGYSASCRDCLSEKARDPEKFTGVSPGSNIINNTLDARMIEMFLKYGFHSHHAHQALSRRANR